MESSMKGKRKEKANGSPPRVCTQTVDLRSNVRQGPLIRWDRFFPRRALRVLLVEHDDSTRQVVTALLSKCSYNVAGVADGMKAWDLMKEKRYCFDLVLAEVSTPSLSGIGLLTRIVGTEECKNIPVIMMSTHDSINVVLKCMSKGAVDFLVKPVRKNELRNLWQHVWRRHCPSSSTSATDNNTASNQISLDDGERSKAEERSDAQSSDSKPDIDAESARQRSKHPPEEDRRCALEGGAVVEHPNNKIAILEKACSSKMHHGGETSGYLPVRIEEDVTLPIQETSVAETSQGRNHSCSISPSREDFVRSRKGDNDNSRSCHENNAQNGSLQNTIVFVEPMSNVQYNYTVSERDALVEDGLCINAKSYPVEGSPNIGTSPTLKLSLRSPQTNGCLHAELKEKHVLKYSDASAFSRYGDKGIHPSWHKSISSALSSSGIDNGKNLQCSSEKRLLSPQGNEDEATVYLQVSSNNIENTSLLPCPPRDACANHSPTMDDPLVGPPPFCFMPLPIPVGAVPYHNLYGGFGAILHPMFYPQTSVAPQSSSALDKSVTQIHSYQSDLHNSYANKHSSPVKFSRCEETHQPHHWRQAIDITELGDARELPCTLMEQTYRSESCGHGVRKGSGSNGSGEAANRVGTSAIESGNESGVQNCERRVLDCDRSRREAALMKFRMKRKDRCFEKKVRYDSRKKLAEQRPRVKGQFVRQNFPDSMATSEADRGKQLTLEDLDMARKNLAFTNSHYNWKVDA